MTSEPSTVRAFLAVGINDEVRAALSALRAEWQKLECRVSWVRPENLHITLVFLGDIAVEKVPVIAQKLDESVSSFASFNTRIGEVGWFGSSRSPRVIWAGVDDERGLLSAVYDEVSDGIRDLGIPVERRKFKPHITLGRVRSSKGVRALTSAVALAKNTQHGEALVDRILLMKSDLKPQGPHYSVLHDSLLKGDVFNGG